MRMFLPEQLSRHLWFKISEVKRTEKVGASCIPSNSLFSFSFLRQKIRIYRAEVKISRIIAKWLECWYEIELRQAPKREKNFNLEGPKND